MWTPNNIIGLLCLVAAAVVPWLVPDADAGRGMGSALTVLGGMLVGWAPPAPGVRPPDQRGALSHDALMALAALSALAIIFVALISGTGCSSAPVVLQDDKPILLSVDSGPPCHLLGQHGDGETAIEYTAPGTCDPHVSLQWLCRRVRRVLAVGEPEPLVCRTVQP